MSPHACAWSWGVDGRECAKPQVPGVPIMYLAARKFTIERLPEATMGGAPRI